MDSRLGAFEDAVFATFSLDAGEAGEGLACCGAGLTFPVCNGEGFGIPVFVSLRGAERFADVSANCIESRIAFKSVESVVHEHCNATIRPWFSVSNNNELTVTPPRF